MTVNAPKTPGMTMRRTKRKIPEKKIEIDVDSPNTSIVSEVQGRTLNFHKCMQNITSLVYPKKAQSVFSCTYSKIFGKNMQHILIPIELSFKMSRYIL